jgi:hypothetical protein
MPTTATPGDRAIELGLQNSALMYDIGDRQRRNMARIARAQGFTIERIAEHIGRSYTATRALLLGGHEGGMESSCTSCTGSVTAGSYCAECGLISAQGR